MMTAANIPPSRPELCIASTSVTHQKYNGKIIFVWFWLLHSFIRGDTICTVNLVHQIKINPCMHYKTILSILSSSTK